MVVAEGIWIGSSVLSLLGLGFAACCCDEQQQQQQQILNISDDGKSKRVCPDCGMENPKEADFCGDCGFSFSTTKEDDNE
jgi:ribosomal protein S27AE